jgi:hypothetical protein
MSSFCPATEICCQRFFASAVNWGICMTLDRFSVMVSPTFSPTFSPTVESFPVGAIPTDRPDATGNLH